MTRKRNRKSPFSKYKTSVKYFMVQRFNWDNQEALDWLNSHMRYTLAMFELTTAPVKTARLITEQRKSYVE
jgi:hypothetical protein